LARRLFDDGIFSVIAPSGGIGVGWLLNFYTAGTTTRITTYNDGTAGSANANPVVADANGRFGPIWIVDNQSIKWVLTDQNGANPVSLDNIAIEATQTAPDPSLTNFLAGTAALPIANGGTAATSAANALVNLGALPAAGGNVSGNITRTAKGAHAYFNDAAMVKPIIYVTASGASDPRSGSPGEVWLKY
jgi:hypothetical protein